jgi:hypothetical protein
MLRRIGARAPVLKPSDDIPVEVIQPPRIRGAHRPLAGHWVFAGWMAVGAVIAVVAGSLLGLLAAMEVGPGLDRWSQTVQAHGALQLIGWASVFVAALTFEFVVRLNGRRPLPLSVRLGVPAVLGAGALFRGAGQLWHDDIWWMFHLGSLLIVLGAVGFVAALVSVRPARSLRVDVQPAWFWAAGLWLFVAAVLALVSGFRANTGVLRLAESHLSTELLLRGFIFCSITAVAVRAFPGHLGTRPVSFQRQLAILALSHFGIALLIAGSPAFGLPGSTLLMRAGDVVFGSSIVLLIAWLGVLSPQNMGREPTYRLLIPVAWLGAATFAIALAVSALLPGERTLYQTGAIRHVFMLGFMAPLMVAMSHIVLDRFLQGAMVGGRFLTGAFVLLVVAWPLRVVPALFTDSPPDQLRPLLSTSAVLVMVALALLAGVAVANLVRARRVEGHHLPHGAHPLRSP